MGKRKLRQLPSQTHRVPTKAQDAESQQFSAILSNLALKRVDRVVKNPRLFITTPGRDA